MKYCWIITESGTDSTGASVSKFDGTVDEVKQLLYKLIRECVEMDETIFDYGCETIDDIKDESIKKDQSVFRAEAVFSDYHTDICAVRFDTICAHS